MSLKIDLTKQSTRPQYSALDLSGLLGGGLSIPQQQDSSRVVMLPIGRLHPFHEHTYTVADDAEMKALTQSIRENGLLEALKVRPYRGDYEIISGHRRQFAATRAGLAELPCIVEEMDDDTAVIRMVEANRYRERKLPSEKARSYRAAAEAVNRQGRRTDLYGVDDAACTPSLSEITGESERNARNWMRLTELIPPLLNMVDVGVLLPVRAGVELSFLIADAQWMVHDYLLEADKPLTVAQAVAIKDMRLTLTPGLLHKLLDVAAKAVSPPPIKLKKLELQQMCSYIPESYRETSSFSYIIKALEYYGNHLNG